MPTLVAREIIIERVAQDTKWVIDQRMDKLRQEMHDTMSVSPFLIPILFDLHSAISFEELGDLLLAGHLMIGHTTSFGKLIDEKVLPGAFGAKKLDAKYRRLNPPLKESCFNEIDHLVQRPEGKPALLSLKASRWTINLSGAKALNAAFAEILHDYSDQYDEIVVGIFNGTLAGLSDKYDILRGINRGKNHDVIDVQANVQVLAGKDFWAWMNGGEPLTQEWILDGILEGLKRANCREESKKLLKGYTNAFNRFYAQSINSDGSVNWHHLLAMING